VPVKGPGLGFFSLASAAVAKHNTTKQTPSEARNRFIRELLFRWNGHKDRKEPLLMRPTGKGFYCEARLASSE
jgi:hypothetical protein